VREFAESLGVTPAQLALAWVLAQWECVLPIPGTKKRSYLMDNAGAAAVELSATVLEQIDRALPESLVHGERYPEIMLETLNN
jgi:aryl-alcohol dehydrogenase-like predicted oxidoreductase